MTFATDRSAPFRCYRRNNGNVKIGYFFTETVFNNRNGNRIDSDIRIRCDGKYMLTSAILNDNAVNSWKTSPKDAFDYSVPRVEFRDVGNLYNGSGVVRPGP